MDTLMSMQYADYALYVYIRHIINNNSNYNSEYFTSLIYSLKTKIESKEYKEEELLTKYILFLVHHNIFKSYYTPSIHRKFYKIFEYLKEVKQLNSFKRVILWGYNLLLGRKQEAERCLEIKDQDISAKIELTSNTTKDKDTIISEEERKKYYNEFTERITQETKEIFSLLSVPLLCIDSKPKSINTVVEDIISYKLLAEEEIEETIKENKSILQMPENKEIKKEKKEKEEISFTERYKQINIESLLNTDVKGVEVKWDESEFEDKPEEEVDSYTYIINNSKRAKKIWTLEDTNKLIMTLQKCGTDWQKVQSACGFKNTTKEQIIDKYKNLVKAKKMERVKKKKDL
ncbi:hypothetical protein NEPAR06_1596 [Nematocida parisii]|uniref:Myb-like domain-containing protein n=1 Tax=Nematocida parisii (strain ERTm3) TaxID=935791 RepID=I3EJB5_NEMP3|nr:uncharacterized protein NEPG_02549 [Nematocida parisii ERTm1]EIJ89312.1 hypothetical protein NEQG_00082 [Nematocida parisii ERTm3]KAI5125678.1 hypothetical protein NEPAR03_0206 [Nematocida parisii]EIJ92661.1 hypothetical protein NEPG_02549 [Nematocida parisii ERTm1]KAI5125700.1 hypothetical protein NEPAR08_0138 [Nematocida parisii]KAI5140267.1 hypothetical protein NEPAR04_0212 [Nematocida parisii]|eukprot:XP_013060376.1 hypothetical protein NEPG_02549 [Nematocida parisii ERTm1]